MEVNEFFRRIPITDNTLGTEHPEILEGLRNGDLRRFGGVIHKSPGSPDGGEIVAHLRDLVGGDGQPSPVQIPDSPPPLSGQASQALSETLQMSQVAAAASVLNLGVSIAGFAYMAKRMNDLQRDLATLQQKMEEGFDRINEKLDVVLRRLEEIGHIVTANHVQGETLLEEVRAIRSALFGEQKGELLAALEMVDVGESELEDHLQTFKKVRYAMEEELQNPPAFRNVHRVIDVGMRLRVWAMAAAAEALALVRLNEEQAAAARYDEASDFVLDRGREWVNQGLPEPDWTLWANSAFEDSVSEDRLHRLASLFEDDLSRSRLRQKTGEGAVQHDAYANKLTEEEKCKHDSLAALADTAVEVGHRLGSNGAEIRFCREHGIPVDQWQQIGSDDGTPLMLIPEKQSDWA
ncbi:hypothetical protein [Salinibacter ruber]|jgi:hypothetical protein|uniref:Uncharacterized protein n=1 Tax=Salinibacter ruber TaxID=146919 RepID=A0A9X2UAI6_9BACT|nr:hypothetical protein [Salinibacter ruber]MCS3952784.1 hypothetical protein [Salinibacter ruber]MCS3956433.1 hypothetical protein [Salinibacter ruber]